MMKIKIHFDTFRFAILLVFLALCIALGKFLRLDFFYYKSLLLEFPIFISGCFFIILYVGITFLAWIAKDILKLVGAVLFGAYISTVLIWIAEIINIVVLFNISRYLGRNFVARKLTGKFAKLDEKIAESNFLGIFALRSIPLVPFRFLDLAAGLTRISFKKYFFISILASPIRIFWVQFILAGTGESILRAKNIRDITPILTEYLMQNTIVFVWSFIYLVLVIILLGWLRKNKKA